MSAEQGGEGRVVLHNMFRKGVSRSAIEVRVGNITGKSGNVNSGQTPEFHGFPSRQWFAQVKIK